MSQDVTGRSFSVRITRYSRGFDANSSPPPDSTDACVGQRRFHVRRLLGWVFGSRAISLGSIDYLYSPPWGA